MCRILTTLTHINEMEGYWGCIYTVLGKKKGTIELLHHFVHKRRVFYLICNSIFTPKSLHCGNNPGPVRGDSTSDGHKPRRRIVAN